MTVTSEESRTSPRAGTSWPLLPIGGIGTVAAILFENSAFFDEESFWHKLPGLEQGIFTAAASVVALVIMACITAFFPSWRTNFWVPIGGAIAKGIRWVRSWRLVRSQDATVEPSPGATPAATPTMRIASTVRRLGSFNVSRRMDGARTVSWSKTGFQIGILHPASGDRWEVIYGRRNQTGALAQFIEIENLGYANTELEAATMLGERDKEEASESTTG